MVDLFDDVTYGDEGVWSQICSACVEKLGVCDSQLDDSGSGICGVQGCWNEADYYIDFEPGE